MANIRKIIKLKNAGTGRIFKTAFILIAALFTACGSAFAGTPDNDILYLYYSRFVPEKIRVDSRFAGRAAPKKLSGFPARDATLVRLAVVRSWKNLSEETRRELGRYMNVDVNGAPIRYAGRVAYYTIGSCSSYLTGISDTRSSEHFTVTYTTASTSQDKVSASGSSGTPLYVENILQFAEETWERQIDTLGFTPPPMPAGRYQIYVCDLLGRSGGTLLGGTATPVQPSGLSAESILELDNDYMPSYYLYSDSVENLLKTTVAHEFFHAIQFGLNYFYPSFWALEATAVWAEPEVYPDIDDWITLYVRDKRLNNLDLSFDYFSSNDTYGYGNAILFKHITEKATGSSMMKAWWDLVKNDTQACKSGYQSLPNCWDSATGIYHEAVEIPQLSQTLTTYGTTLASVFKSFMVANYTKDYIAGAGFSNVPLEASYSAYPSSVTSKSLDHLAGLFYKFTPVSSTYSQRLTVSFNGGAVGTWGAILLKYDSDGNYRREDISLSSRAGSLSVDGFGTTVKSVVLAVVNASSDDTGDGSFSFTATAANDCTSANSSPSNLRAGWSMVTFPVTPLYTDPNTAVTITSPAGPLNNGSIVYYDPASGSSYYGSQSGFQALGKTGQAYWVSLSAASTLSIQGCAPAENTITISLEQGWNMFGLPFKTATDVIWGDSRVTVLRNGGTSTHTLSEAVANGWLEPKIYWYNGASYDEIVHNTGVSLTPWYGYWIKVGEPLELRLKTITG